MFISINNSFVLRMEGYSPVVKPEKEEKIEIKHTIGEIPGQREHSGREPGQSGFSYATGRSAALCSCSLREPARL